MVEPSPYKRVFVVTDRHVPLPVGGIADPRRGDDRVIEPDMRREAEAVGEVFLVLQDVFVAREERRFGREEEARILPPASSDGPRECTRERTHDHGGMRRVSSHMRIKRRCGQLRGRGGVVVREPPGRKSGCFSDAADAGRAGSTTHQTPPTCARRSYTTMSQSRRVEAGRSRSALRAAWPAAPAPTIAIDFAGRGADACLL